jgi:hypothetical protein
VNLFVLVVDDEPDVEVLFRQQFRHDLRAGKFARCSRSPWYIASLGLGWPRLCY